jgi:hypothetical protein
MSLARTDAVGSATVMWSPTETKSGVMIRPAVWGL